MLSLGGVLGGVPSLEGGADAEGGSLGAELVETTEEVSPEDDESEDGVLLVVTDTVSLELVEELVDESTEEVVLESLVGGVVTGDVSEDEGALTGVVSDVGVSADLVSVVVEVGVAGETVPLSAVLVSLTGAPAVLVSVVLVSVVESVTVSTDALSEVGVSARERDIILKPADIKNPVSM